MCNNIKKYIFLNKKIIILRTPLTTFFLSFYTNMEINFKIINSKNRTPYSINSNSIS